MRGGGVYLCCINRRFKHGVTFNEPTTLPCRLENDSFKVYLALKMHYSSVSKINLSIWDITKRLQDGSVYEAAVSEAPCSSPPEPSSFCDSPRSAKKRMGISWAYGGYYWFDRLTVLIDIRSPKCEVVTKKLHYES